MRKIKLFYGLTFLFIISLSGCNIFDDDTTTIDDEIKSEITDNITESVTWKEGSTIIIGGGIRVGGSQTVVITIEPGVTVKFAEGAYLDFAYRDNTYATIIAKGTKDKPIRFTSNSPSPSAGNWKGLNFYKGAVNCEFDNCIFEYGGSNNSYGNIYIEETAVAITNCQFLNSASTGIILKENGNFSAFTGNTFTAMHNYPVSIYPNGISSMGSGNIYEQGASIYVDADNNLTQSGSFTWKNQGIPFVFDGGLRAGTKNSQGMQLTIEPGMVIRFTESSYIDFSYSDDEYATVIAKGTADNHIVFTSNSPSQAAGDWKSLNFYKGAVNCEFEYCDFKYGGAYEYHGMVYIEDKVSFKNCSFTNSKSYGIRLDETGEFSAFTNNSFSNHQTAPVYIYPNAVTTMGTSNSFESGSMIVVYASANLDKSGNHTWLNQGVPYRMSGQMRVGSTNGTTLTINAGTVLAFESGSGIEVAYWDENTGKLICNGEIDNIVTFTSVSPSPQKGDWKGIYFNKNVADSKLNYCLIDYAGSNEYNGAVSLDDSGNNTITISNSTISHSASYGITVDNNSSVDYSTVTFIDNDGEDYHVR